MSATQTGNLMFAEAAVRTLPGLACVGHVASVGEGKVSEKGVYIVQPVTIHGFGASPNQIYRVLYRPEWFVPGFNPDSYESQGDEGKSLLSVYRRNIAGKKSISALKGLAGSDAAFATLASQLLGAGIDPEDTTGTVSTVQAILTEFFAENLGENGDPAEIGYELKQKREKTGETDANGKAIYELADGYEIDKWWFITNDAINSYRKRAAKSGGKFKVAFETE